MVCFRAAQRIGLLPRTQRYFKRIRLRSFMDGHNPLNAEVYEVKGQIYRRNVPLDHMNQVGADCTIIKDVLGLNEEDEEGGLSQVAGYKRSSANVQEGHEEKAEENAGMEDVVDEIDSIQYDPDIKKFCASIQISEPISITPLLGFKGSKNQKQLEKATDCKLKINKNGATIDIIGESVGSVQKCIAQVRKLLAEDQKKVIPSHFVSIELLSDTLQEAYAKLVEQILSDEEISEECKEKSLFRPVEKLHLTVSVLCLPTKEDKEIVKKCINDLFKTEIRNILVNSHEIGIKFGGLDYFGSSPSKANVVYAKISSEQLQRVANTIDDALTKTGLAEKRRTDEVKLHLTIINTKNAKKGFKYHKINASELLKKFGDFKFDPVTVNELRLCSMRGKDPTTNGYQSIFSTRF